MAYQGRQHQREVSDQGAGETVQMVIVIIREEDEQSCLEDAITAACSCCLHGPGSQMHPCAILTLPECIPFSLNAPTCSLAVLGDLLRRMCTMESGFIGGEAGGGRLGGWG